MLRICIFQELHKYVLMYSYKLSVTGRVPNLREPPQGRSVRLDILSLPEHSPRPSRRSLAAHPSWMYLTSPVDRRLSWWRHTCRRCWRMLRWSAVSCRSWWRSRCRRPASRACNRKIKKNWKQWIEKITSGLPCTCPQLILAEVYYATEGEYKSI